MVNKKGYIRTIEAIIAVVLLFLFILTTLPKPEKSVEPRNVDYIEESILLEIESNEVLRQEVLNYIPGGTTPKLNSFIEDTTKRLPFDHAFLIKNAGTYPSQADLENLIPSVSDRNLYLRTKIIGSGTVSKVIYLYLWEKTE